SKISRAAMEVALTPLELARRTRTLYADREAMVDGSIRLTYAQFFERADRWSAALQQLGVRAGDRIAYIAPNTHAQLVSFYAVPQLGAVLVPINYRLSADEFAYIIGHSGASVVCAHEDYLESVDGIRAALPAVRHFVALEGLREGRPLAAGASPSPTDASASSTPGARAGWLDYETLIAEAPSDFVRAAVDER